jgi:hypothetical protein
MHSLARMRRLFSARLFLLFVVMSLSGCATFNQVAQTRQAIEQSKFELTRVEPRIEITAPSLGPQGVVPGRIDIGFTLRIIVDNRFGRDLPLNRLDIKLYGDNELIATATTTKPWLLSHRRPTAITAFVGVEPRAATRNLVKRLKGNQMSYHIDGVFYFNVDQFEIPVRMTLKRI